VLPLAVLLDGTEGGLEVSFGALAVSTLVEVKPKSGLPALAWLALLAGACASRPTREQLRLTTTGSQFDSSNGYRFVVLPDHSAQVVRVHVRYPIGAAHDPPGKEGLAHLVEHLLFDLRVPREGGVTSISAELGRLAHFWNAETALDYTHYVSQGPPESLDGLMRVEADRMSVGCGGITREIFEREKEIVLNEMGERSGTGATLGRALSDALYPAGHPYRRAATAAAVERLVPSDACGFLRDVYPEGRAVLVVSGAVTEREVRAAAARHIACRA
jgi:zinc protease